MKRLLFYPVGLSLLFLPGLMLHSAALYAIPPISYLQAKAGDVIQIKLSELHPTQMAVGKLQIAGDLAEYTQDKRALFKALCKAQGAGKLREMSLTSTPRDPTTYTCQLAMGTDKKTMSTVDVGPMGRLYLIDGHHGINGFWHATNDGEDVILSVLVEQNLSHGCNGSVLTQAQFEKRMAALKQFLPIDAQGKSISFSQLPKHLGLNHFQNDPYRSMLYYLRGIAYDKPEKNIHPKTGAHYPAVPFLEFYWGQLLREKMDLKHYNLNDQDGYIKALNDAASVINGVAKDQLIGDSGKTAEVLGQMKSIDKKQLKKLAKLNSKLAYALGYQSQLLRDPQRMR